MCWRQSSWQANKGRRASRKGRTLVVVESNVGALVSTEAAVSCGGSVTNVERLTRLAVRVEEQAQCGVWLPLFCTS